MTRTAAGILRMARWMASLFFIAVFVAACGGDDDGAAPVQQVHPPTVANLRYSPTSALQAPGGTVTITGTFDFADLGADIASLWLTTSAGGDVSTPTPQLTGANAGTAIGQVVVSVDKPGKYTFEIWVMDSRGSASNRLSGLFEVLQRPSVEPTDHAPAIVNLTHSPQFAYQSAGSATVKGSVDFVDAGGDVAGIRIAGSWGVDQVVALPGLTGVTSGSAPFELLVPLAQGGALTFEVSVLDSAAVASNRLVGTFQVLTPAPAEHRPTIGNLRSTPLSVFQSVGGTVAITCTIDFADTLGDIVAMRLVGTSGVDATVSTPALNGVKSGTTTIAFGVPATQVGKVPFEVWAIDATGGASNRLAGTYEILPPDGWTTASSPGLLNAIAFSNGRYVAVGPGGTVATSLDATAWAVQSVGASVTLHSAAGSGSRFVAVGETGDGRALLISSTDGGTWTPAYQANAPSALFKVIWGGTQFVAVGHERGTDGLLYALILVSPDGLSWTRSPQVIEVGDFGIHPRGVTSVAWSGSLYVAVGLDPNWEPVAWRSTDAMTWSAPVIIADAIWAFAISDVAHGNGLFLAVNSLSDSTGDSPVLLSTDGINWRSDAMPGNLPGMNAVMGGPGSYLAVGPDYRMTSTDGVVWALTPMSQCGNGVAWDGVRSIAVGQAICRSP